MPCAVGMAPLFACECYASSAKPPPALNLLTPLPSLAQRLGEPIRIPEDMPPVPASVELDGAQFNVGGVRGAAVFDEVDTNERTFAGRLESLELSLTSVAETLTCSVGRAPFSAEAGNFL